MSELKINILNFGYGINFKYERMLYHSFDRYYVVMRFVLPAFEDLNFHQSNLMQPVVIWMLI